MDSMEPVYNLSPMCNLSEDELEAVNSTNVEFAMWDPYKDKKRADEAEKQIEIYKERAVLAEAKVEELLNIIKLSRNELIKNNVKESIEETVLPEEKPNRWLSCLSTKYYLLLVFFFLLFLLLVFFLFVFLLLVFFFLDFLLLFFFINPPLNWFFLSSVIS